MHHGPHGPSRAHAEGILLRDDLDLLIGLLAEEGYTVVAPTVVDGAITYGRIKSGNELPAGFSDHQEAGTYRLIERTDDAVFAWASGPRSWKDFLRTPVLQLFSIRKTDGAPAIEGEQNTGCAPIAFVGVHACDIAALARLDVALLQQEYADEDYRRRRENLLVIAAECTRPSPNCFCHAAGCGPTPDGGYDLMLLEILEDEHRFVARAGTGKGEHLLARLPHRIPDHHDVEAAARVRTGARSRLRGDTRFEMLAEDLMAAIEDPRWEDLGSRCLACGNCTQVCPTCFCTTVEDSSSLDGATAERWRKPDSCFTLGFSYIHGGSVRASIGARYRHRIMHKFVYWNTQFGSPGCVGCGRCTTWCPAGIDVQHELQVFRTRQRQREVV